MAVIFGKGAPLVPTKVLDTLQQQLLQQASRQLHEQLDELRAQGDGWAFMVVDRQAIEADPVPEIARKLAQLQPDEPLVLVMAQEDILGDLEEAARESGFFEKLQEIVREPSPGPDAVKAVLVSVLSVDICHFVVG